MERFCSKHGFGLLTRIIAVFLIACSLVACFPPRPAEAFIEELIAALVILACEAALKTLMPKLTEEAGGSLEAAAKTYLYDAMIITQQNAQFKLEKELYGFDHRGLAADGIKDMTPYIAGVYAASPRSDGNSFGVAWSGGGFDGANPGYRAGGAVIFSEEYKRRTDGFDNYLRGALGANRTAAESLTASDSPVGAVRAGVLGEALYEAGEFTEGGYRELAQAASQIETLSNQHAAALRSDTARQNDAVARYALNEIQERTDRQAAFGQAVNTWNPAAASSGGY
ncbi:MAG: hypothetical protein LBU26_04185 [Synergistaceae bacterium]|jgi:hypothetical protein|nr:hypothetical protein [Synergistaceae bacterium]